MPKEHFRHPTAGSARKGESFSTMKKSSVARAMALDLNVRSIQVRTRYGESMEPDCPPSTRTCGPQGTADASDLRSQSTSVTATVVTARSCRHGKALYSLVITGAHTPITLIMPEPQSIATVAVARCYNCDKMAYTQWTERTNRGFSDRKSVSKISKI